MYKRQEKQMTLNKRAFSALDITVVLQQEVQRHRHPAVE